MDFFPRQHHLRGLLSVNKAIGIGITFLANGSDKFTKKRSYDPPFTAFKKRSKTKTGAFDNTLKKPQLFDFHTENAEEKPILVYRLVLLLDVFRHFFHIVSFSSKAPGRFNSENSLLIATLRRLVFRSSKHFIPGDLAILPTKGKFEAEVCGTGRILHQKIMLYPLPPRQKKKTTQWKDKKMICKPKRSTSYVVTNMITTSHFEPKKHKPKSSHAFGKNRALPYHHPIPSSTHQSLAFHPPPGDKGDVLRKPKFRGKKDHQEEGRYLPSMKLAEPHRHLKRYHVLKVTSSSSSTLTFQVQTVSLWESVSSQRSNLRCQKEIAKLYQPIVVVTKHDGKNIPLRISKTVTRSFHLKSASSVETGLAMHGC